MCEIMTEVDKRRHDDAHASAEPRVGVAAFDREPDRRQGNLVGYAFEAG